MPKAQKKEPETTSETFSVKGEQLVERVKEIVQEGNARRIIIKNKDGVTIAQFPLTFGVVGAALLPVFAAIGAIAALVTECSITVERAKAK